MKRDLSTLGGALDDRLHAAGYARKTLKKAFPDHWSFLLGELALYSFVILVLTGVFLTFFFQPSLTESVYHGSYTKLAGVRMSEAYASTVHISFDIRGGLLMRQIHHWAALLFVAAIAVHALRMFFTGAFRKPRELSWVIGTVMFALAALEGFCGYSLPDDLLSGTGLRIADGIMLSVPVAGTYLSFFLFGGQYPGEVIVSRLYIIHVLLIPGLLLALVTAHVMLVWHQGHTQWPGRKKPDRNEIGEPIYPVFGAKTTSLFFFVFGSLCLLGAVAQINPIWLFGPYNAAVSSNGSQPDWYIGFLEGALRLTPSWETSFLGHTIEWGVLIPGALLPAAFFVLMGGYPFAERWITGDRRPHPVLDRPRNMPARTGLGVAIVALAVVVELAGADDVIAYRFGLSVQSVVWALRACFFVLPVVAFLMTRRVCVALERGDRQRARHGIDAGIAVQSADGEGIAYTGVSRPLTENERAVLTTVRADQLYQPVPRHLLPLPTPRRAAAQLRARLNHFYVVSRLENPRSDGTDENQGE